MQEHNARETDKGGADKPAPLRQTSPGTWAWLAVIMALAFGLRYLGLRWGLPGPEHIFSYHPDEFHSLRGAFALILLGDPNPHFFNYGNLYLYLVSAGAYLANPGVIDPEEVISVTRLLHDWTLAGRAVTVCCSLATVAVVYALVERTLGRTPALLAALAVAVFPLHVLHSHYATVDVPQVLFITLGLYWAVRIVQTGTTRDYLWAGICAGLAASVKYNGGLVLIAPLIAHTVATLWSGSGRRFWDWRPLATIGLTALAFALTSPFVLLDWENASRDIFYEIEHMQAGEEPARSADPNTWLFHFTALTLTTGGATVFSLLGLWGLRQAGRLREFAGPVIFSLLWFVMISQAEVRYGRYAVALVPILGILIAAVPLALWRYRAEARLVGVLAVFFVLAASVTVSLPLVWVMETTEDPRDKALAHIESIVPPDREVGLIWEPWFHGPPVDRCNGGEVLRRNPLWSRFQAPVRPIVVTGYEAQKLRDSRPLLQVVSNFEMRDHLRVGTSYAVELNDVLKEEYLLSAIFRRPAPLDTITWWHPPQDWLYAFPEVTIYMARVQDAEDGETPSLQYGAIPPSGEENSRHRESP